MKRKKRKVLEVSKYDKFEVRWTDTKEGGENQRWGERFEALANRLGVKRAVIARLLVEEWIRLSEASPDLIREAANRVNQTKKK